MNIKHYDEISNNFNKISEEEPNYVNASEILLPVHVSQSPFILTISFKVGHGSHSLLSGLGAIQ